MKLKAETATVFEYKALAELVFQAYGQKIDILNDMIPLERRGHYTYHDFTVDAESELYDIADDCVVDMWIKTGHLTALDLTESEFWQDDWSEEWYGEADVQVHHVMNRLFKDGHIAAGRYIMLVDW